MSYILDALKKAEADRDPDARASLAIEQRERRRHRLLIYFVLAALLANAVVLVWLFFPETPATTGQTTPIGSRSTPGPDLERPMVRESPPSELSGGARSSSVHSEPTPPPKSTPPAVVSTTLAALPAAARSRFPELTFSTHIYADDPSLRAVVVNGTRLTEGDSVDGVRVDEITESGAVFAFERYLVSVPVLEDWD